MLHTTVLALDVQSVKYGLQNLDYILNHNIDFADTLLQRQTSYIPKS